MDASGLWKGIHDLTGGKRLDSRDFQKNNWRLLAQICDSASNPRRDVRDLEVLAEGAYRVR